MSVLSTKNGHETEM